MHYVVLRDDDTNALTPVDCLERLYRPFLDRGLPVNLATIPNVSTTATMPDGRPEGYLGFMTGELPATLAIGDNRELVEYLLANPGFRIVQHGYRHDWFEFDCSDLEEVKRRLMVGDRLLQEAGFPGADAFV